VLPVHLARGQNVSSGMPPQTPPRPVLPRPADAIFDHVMRSAGAVVVCIFVITLTLASLPPGIGFTAQYAAAL